MSSAENGRRYYTEASVRSELDALEDRFDMTSECFMDVHRNHGRVPGVPGFETNVWCGLFETWLRLCRDRRLARLTADVPQRPTPRDEAPS